MGTVPGSSSEKYLQRSEFPFARFKCVVDAIRALDRGDVSAVVYDVPMLRYLSTTQTQHRTRDLPDLIDHEPYGFALQSASKLREPLNLALLEVIGEADWEALIQTYVGG